MKDEKPSMAKQKIEVEVPKWTEAPEKLPEGTYHVPAVFAGCSVRCSRPGLKLVDFYRSE